MSGGRRSSRRQAVFILYQGDLLKLDAESALERAADEQASEFAREIVRGVQSEQERLDDVLGHHLSGWSVDRLGVLERAILRVAVYEMLEERDVPLAVVIDEAVNLAKRFCSSEAGAFINGVLGGVAKAVRPDVPESAASEESR